VKFAYVAGCKEDEEAKKRRLTLTRTTGADSNGISRI